MMMAVLSPKQKFITSEFDLITSVDYYYLSMKHNSIFLQTLGELILVKVREIFIYIDNVQCNGSESHLEECPSSDVGDHDCSHPEDAGVSCQGMCWDIIILNPLP